MSESIYICAGSLCCTLLICSILRVISPSGSTQKIMSVVICVFSLCCLVSPVYEFVSNIKLNYTQKYAKDAVSDNFEADYDKAVLKQTAEYINAYVYKLLESCSAENAKIETILSSDDKKGIYISGMNIYLNGNENVNIKKISDAVFSATGVKPNITEYKYG
ncbi:MAG: stage III sporulation protein AF [Ruminococcus sp.]|nr:stage III sporulation protein AF [Ruminococcus sp.]